MKRNILLVGGFIAASFGVVATQVVSRAPSPAIDASPAKPPTAPAKSVAVAVTAPYTPRTSCVFARGDAMTYSMEFDSNARIEAFNQEVTAQLTSTLAFVAIEANTDSAVLAGRFFDVNARGAGLDAAALASPFLVRVQSDCSLSAFARMKQAGRSAARNQQALVWESQFRLSKTQEQQAENGNGTYVADVALEAETGTIRRETKKYVALWNQPQSSIAADGRAVITLGNGPWFESVNANETFRYFQNSHSALRLKKRAAAPDALLAHVDGNQFVWENLLPLQIQERVARKVTQYDLDRRARVAPQTVEQAFRGFYERSADSKAGIQETWPDLAAYFEVHPEAIAHGFETLSKNEMPADSIANFYLAVGKARVPQAKEALLTVLRNTAQPPMDRTRSMFALIDRDDVGKDFAQELATLAKPNFAVLSKAQHFVATEASLAVTTMAGITGNDEINAVAAEAVQHVLKTSPRESVETRVALKALGNLGNAKLVSVAEPFTREKNLETRMAAAHVLRRMKPKETEGFVLDWLGREKHPFVKAEIYAISRAQHDDAHVGASEALVRQALRDMGSFESGVNRKNIVQLVGQSSVVKDRWVREALLAQAVIEHRKNTGYLNAFTDILTPEEVWSVIK